jgi:hypothetical protein
MANIKHFQKVELSVPESKQSIKDAKIELIADESERDHYKFIEKV